MQKVLPPTSPICSANEKDASINFLILLTTVFLVIQGAVYLLHRLHLFWLPESIVITLLGIGFGAIFKFGIPARNHILAQMDVRMFFVAFLPAIIFDAGYTLDRVIIV